MPEYSTWKSVSEWPTRVQKEDNAHREPLDRLWVRVELDHELLAVGADAEDEVAADIVVRAHAGCAVHRVLLDELVCARVGAGLVAGMRFATDDEGWGWGLRLRSRHSTLVRVKGPLVYW